MNIIKIKVEKNRMVECETISAGVTGENGETQLKFVVPDEYKNYYKYLDIVKSDSSKTQTLADNENKSLFYYTLPRSLTDGNEIIIQLVMKFENKIFKSNAFSLSFNPSIEATQLLEDEYQDVIEYLMENKADKNDLYAFDKRLSHKVDKEMGKGLTSNDYTDEDKEKLSALPTKITLEEALDKKATCVTIDINTGIYHKHYIGSPVYETTLVDTYNKPGVYFISLKYLNVYEEILDLYNYCLTVVPDSYTNCVQILSDCEDGSIRKRTADMKGLDGFPIWNDWMLVDNHYSIEEKDKLSSLPLGESVSNSYKNTLFGNPVVIDDASPIGHSLKIKVHGKNIFDLNGNYGISTPYGKNEKTETGIKVTATSTNTAQSIRLSVPGSWFEVGRTYVFSSTLISNNIDIFSGKIRFGQVTTGSNKCKFTYNVEVETVNIYIYQKDSLKGDIYTADNIQIEEGTVATDYEKFINPSSIKVLVGEKEYIPSLDGVIEGIESISSEMTLSSDNEGAVISCTYNKDINKVIGELTNAIISLGGNI